MKKLWLPADEEPFSLEVEERFHDLRIDQFLTFAFEEFSRSHLCQSIKTGMILVNDLVCLKPGYRVKAGEIISGSTGLEVEPEPPLPQDVSFSVVVDDPAFLVIDKPAGLVVHPGSGNQDQTLVNGLLHRYGSIAGVGDEFRPGIVHRLDKDTSGIMVVARTKAAHTDLVDQFKNRRVEKTYLALVRGVMTEEQGRIVAPIGRHRIHRQKMAVREEQGRYAASNWKCREKFASHTLVEVVIETGRTHQIRVHLAHLGFPIAGDRLYGAGKKNDVFPRHLLHSWKLIFFHPETGKTIEAIAEPSADFKDALQRLGAEKC